MPRTPATCEICPAIAFARCWAWPPSRSACFGVNLLPASPARRSRRRSASAAGAPCRSARSARCRPWRRAAARPCRRLEAGEDAVHVDQARVGDERLLLRARPGDRARALPLAEVALDGRDHHDERREDVGGVRRPRTGGRVALAWRTRRSSWPSPLGRSRPAARRRTRPCRRGRGRPRRHPARRTALSVPQMVGSRSAWKKFPGFAKTFPFGSVRSNGTTVCRSSAALVPESMITSNCASDGTPAMIPSSSS